MSLSLEQQRIAFRYLGERARLAHQEGDGILVNHLSATALSQLEEYSKAGTLKLPLSEISWMLIFPLFWLIDEYMIRAVGEELERQKPETDAGKELLAFLKAYEGLLANPFHTFNQNESGLDRITLGWVESVRSIEQETLFRHLVELLWCQSSTKPDWSDQAARWRHAAPTWLATSLGQTEERLRKQTPLVILGASVARLPPSGNEAWLQELWECTLDCNWSRIDAIMAERVPQTTMEMPRARFLFDVRHFNRLHGVWGDDQATGLTRRRLAITSFPKLGFDELRSAHCEKLIGQVLRGGKKAEDSDHGHAYRLAILMELEALRLWDRFEWNEAINAQGRLALEMARRRPDLTGMTFHGLTLAIQSFDYSSKVPAIHDAVLALDFAPADQRHEFLSHLLSAQDVYAYQNLQVLTEFADAIPESLLDRVADWSLKYLELAETKTLTGSTSIPLQFWQGIIPYLDEASPVWARLLEPILKMARHPRTWQMDESLLVEYICNAPEPLAARIMREMLATTEGTDGDRFCRWDKLSDALIRRPQLVPQFGLPVLAGAPSASDRYRVAKDLNLLGVGGPEEEARTHLRTKIDEYIGLALSTESSFTMRSGYRGTTPIVVSWTEADADIVDRLVTAIDAPGLRSEYTPHLLMLLRMILTCAPAVLVKARRATLERWMEQLPGAGPINRGIKHPWLITREDLNVEIEEAVIELATAAWLKIADREPAWLDHWASQCPGLYSGKNAPALTALYLRLAHQRSSEARANWLGFFKTQLGIAWGQFQKSNVHWVTIKDVVYQLRDFLESGYSGAFGPVEIGPEFVRAVTQGLEGYWLEFSQAHSPNLRSATAHLLRVLERKVGLSPKLQALLLKLSKDARARVRKASKETR